MIQAIFWDFGGVFTTSPFDAFRRYEAARGLPQDFIRTVNATNPLDNAWARFEASRIDAATFDRQFEIEARALGHAVPGREVLPLLAGELRPRMVAALRRCKANFRNACLTNNVRSGEGAGMARSAEQAAQLQAVMALFDQVIESSREGVRKPEPAFYRLACERMGVAPDEVVYLDDLGVNLKPAAAMGMRTVKVTGEAQALAELGALVGLDFAA
jgi:putative hydrolase of the HAD superfamily